MKFETNCVQELKNEIEGKIDEVVVALRRREEALKEEVEVVVSGDDAREGWKVVGDWAGLERMIDRCGGLMRRRKRNESFEVIWQENMEAVDKMKENVVDEDEDVDDGVDDDVENGGFIFKFKNEKDEDKALFKYSFDSDITQVKQKQQELTSIDDNKTINKQQNEQNIDFSDNKDLMDLDSGSFIFKMAPKLEQLKEKVMVKDEDVSSFKFTFGDNDRSNQPLITSENLKNNSDYDDEDICFKFNLRNDSDGSEDTVYSTVQKEENSFKCYKFDLNNENITDLKIKNNSLSAIEPFVFRLEETITTPKISDKKDGGKLEMERLSETFCFRLMEDLKIKEENKDDSFCFKFNSLKSPISSLHGYTRSPLQYGMGLCL